MIDYKYALAEGGLDCSPPPSETNLKLSANVSSSSADPVDVCEPVDFTIAGGTPPYTITIAALNQTVTNITFEADASLTWYNTANPNSEFIGEPSCQILVCMRAKLISAFLVAIISDADGFGQGTGFFKTTGSDLRTCPGPIPDPSPNIKVPDTTQVASSSSSSSSESSSSSSSSPTSNRPSSSYSSSSIQLPSGIPSGSSTRSESPKSSSQTPSSKPSKSPVTVSTIIGAAVGAASMVFIGMTVLLCCYYRRRRRYRRTLLKAEQWINSSRGDLSANEGRYGVHRRNFESIAQASELEPASDTVSSRSVYSATVATITSSLQGGLKNIRTMIQHHDAGDIGAETELPPPYRDRRISRGGASEETAIPKGSTRRVRIRRDEDPNSTDSLPEARETR